MTCCALPATRAFWAPQGTGGMYVREGVHIPSFKERRKRRPDLQQDPPGRDAHSPRGGHYERPWHCRPARRRWNTSSGQSIDKIREREQACMWNFYNGVKDIPGVTVYGDFSGGGRCPIVSLNIGDYDSSEVGDELLTEYGISTRPERTAHPLMHKALGTVDQGAVRFSFSPLHNRRRGGDGHQGHPGAGAGGGVSRPAPQAGKPEFQI